MKLNEQKGRQRSKANRHFLLEEGHENIVTAGGEKMRNVSGNKCKVKMSGREKK